MADAAPKSEGRKGARKHTGLGRGLGALIPQASEQTPQNAPSAPSRPLDVFFPEGSSAGKRGGSAKDLLHSPVEEEASVDAVRCGGRWQARCRLSQRPWRWNQWLRFPPEGGSCARTRSCRE